MSTLGKLVAHKKFLEERSADLIMMIGHLRTIRGQNEREFHRTWDSKPEDWRVSPEGQAFLSNWSERDRNLRELLGECESNLSETIEELGAVQRALACHSY